MSEQTLHVVIGTYRTEQIAEKALKDITQSTKDGEIDIEGIALVEKGIDGKIHVKDAAEISTGRGAAFGGVIGGVIGLLAGPPGVVILGSAGALIGGAITSGDEGIPDERLMDLGETLEPGTSAVVVIVTSAWVEALESSLAKSTQEVKSQRIDAETVARFREE